MADEIPDNLRGFFGGRAASGSSGRLDDAEERLTRAVDKITSLLGRVGTNAGTGWQGTGTRAGSNGGNWSGGHAPQSHRADGESRWTGGGGYEGQRRGEGGGSSGQRSAGYAASAGRMASNMYEAAGGRNGIAASTAKFGAAGVGLYTLNHASDQIVNQSLAMQASGSRDYNPAYQAMFRGNYTAASASDMQQYQRMLSMGGGASATSRTFQQQRRLIEGLSLADPSLTNTASASASLSLGSAGSFNKLAALGINPMGPGGLSGDPMSVARQILSRMGASRVKTQDQLDAAFGPAGSITITLDNYVADGFVSSEAVPAVKVAMRAILRGQIKGYSYGQVRSELSKGSSKSGGASGSFQEATGIGASALAQQRQREGMSRDTEAETINGFITGLTLTTGAVKKMRGIVNEILGVPGVGETFGFASGGTAGGFGGMVSSLSKVTGMLGLGDGPSSLSSASAVYGASAGAGAARGGFGSGGGGGVGGAGHHSARAVASTGSASSSKYSLGQVKPWVAAAANILGPKFGISTIGGWRASSAVANSDHPKGLALDLMCSTEQGNRLAPFAVANAKKLNITYVIWQQRIWSINNPTWKSMEDRGSPTANHMDHVHISFLASPSNSDYTGLSGGGGGGDFGASASSAQQGAGGGAGMTSGNGASVAGPPGASGFSGIGYSQMSALGAGGGGGGGGFGGLMSGSSGTGTSSGNMATDTGLSGGAGTGAGGTVRNGTYNVLFSSNNEGTKNDLQKLFQGADVLGLTEYTGKKAQLGKWIQDQGWGIRKGRGDAAITWNKDKYELLKSADWLLHSDDWPRPGATGGQWATYGLLKDKSTGQQFWEVAAHLISKADPGQADYQRSRTPIQNREVERLNELVKMLSKNGTPVFLTGDLNMDLDRGDWKNIGGLSSNWKPGQKGPGTNHPNNYIDHILSDPNQAALQGSQVVTGLSSDHNGVLAQYLLGASPTANSPVKGNGKTPESARALAQALMSGYGWSNQFGALDQLWNHESGWRWNADNPTSSAYGIPQALPGSKMGKGWHDDPRVQIQWGLDYIKGRYGDPNGAWDFWRKNNWYDKGSWDVPQDQDARIHRKEMLLPATIAEAVRNEFSAPSRKSGGGGIVFQQGSIQVVISGNVSSSDATRTGQQIVDAVVADQRIKDLMAGV